MITITEDYLDYLERRDRFLFCLNEAGVRKLKVWDKAMEIFDNTVEEVE